MQETQSWVYPLRCNGQALLAASSSREATAQNSVVPPMNTANTLEVGTPSTARPYTGVSFASYYGLATNSRLTMPSVAPGDQSRQITESPVYGLDGIIAPTATNVEPDSPVLSQSIRAPSPSTDAPSSSIQRESNNSFDELLRQQTELDKSIAALRLFSPTTTVMSLPVPPEPEKSKSGALLSGRSLSMSSGKSVAKSSVFSLSIFPDPPPVDRSSVYAEPSTSARVADSPLMTARARRQSRIPRSAISRDLDGLSVLGTPSHGRSNSEGTQYDVTSFIDDLTPGPSNEPTLGELLERPEESEASPTASTLRPLLLSSAVPSITSLPPATASSGVLTASSQPPAAAANYEYPVLKPLLLGSSAPSVPSPLSAGSRRTPGPSVFNGPRRPSRPGQGRPVISVPRQLEDEGQDEAEAFERPRRPPALTSEIR
ncbi:hypothetical protein B0H10DRAFT_1016400 [Mycena sp. CBHHK59/15]|nr:hypothetical protein B0H10DRAFT_1016400 [Mycena sp. CBHHK59/15]